MLGYIIILVCIRIHSPKPLIDVVYTWISFNKMLYISDWHCSWDCSRSPSFTHSGSRISDIPGIIQGQQPRLFCSIKCAGQSSIYGYDSAAKRTVQTAALYARTSTNVESCVNNVKWYKKDCIYIMYRYTSFCDVYHKEWFYGVPKVNFLKIEICLKHHHKWDTFLSKSNVFTEHDYDLVKMYSLILDLYRSNFIFKFCILT